MSRGITTAASTFAGLDLRDRLRAREHAHGLDLAEQLFGVAAHLHAFAAHLRSSGPEAFRRRSPPAACRARARSPDRSAARSRSDRRPARPRSSRERRRISRSLPNSHLMTAVPRWPPGQRSRVSPLRQKRHERRLEVSLAAAPFAAISSTGAPSNSSSPSASTIARVAYAGDLAEMVRGEQHGRPCCARARRRTPTAVRAERGSRAEVGSSSASTGGSAIRPSATFTRWRLPPERRSTRSSARSRSPVCSSIRCHRGLAGRPPPPGGRTASGSPRPSSFAYTAGCCGAQPIAAPAPGPSTVPALAGCTPARIDSSVVLPAPFGPTTATSSPGSTSN